MNWYFSWLLFFCFIRPLTAETLPIVLYEPNIVRLTGTLHESTCPGPPEYESIERGDAPEHIFVLNLDSPINVKSIPPDKDGLNEPENNISEIQVAASPRNAQHLIGEHVAITGTLFHAITAHHRTEVVMIDEKIEHLK